MTCLCPSPTATGFAERADVAGTRLFSRPAEPAEVAAVGYRALMGGDPPVITGSVNGAFAFGTSGPATGRGRDRGESARAGVAARP